MKLSNDEVIVAYAALTNALVDLIESDFSTNIYNRQTLKYLSKNLLNELLKITDKIYKECDDFEVVNQHVEAGKAMMHFFVLGLRLTEMDKIKADGLTKQMNILLKNYDVDIKF